MINIIRKAATKIGCGWNMSNSSRVNFCDKKKEGGEDNYGVVFDEEKILNKMKQIKQRQQKSRQQKLDLMPPQKYTPSKLNKKIQDFRQQTGTENIFDFTSYPLQQKPTNLAIAQYSQDAIAVDNFEYPPFLIWEVQSVTSLKIQDFVILDFVKPKPSYVILGVNNPMEVSMGLREQLRGKVQNFDVLPIFEASSQFNTCAGDDIQLVMFMITK